MRDKKAARRCGNNKRARTSTRDGNIITFEHGSRVAGWLLCAMFAFLTVGTVMFGW